LELIQIYPKFFENPVREKAKTNTNDEIMRVKLKLNSINSADQTKFQISCVKLNQFFKLSVSSPHLKIPIIIPSFRYSTFFYSGIVHLYRMQITCLLMRALPPWVNLVTGIYGGAGFQPQKQNKVRDFRVRAIEVR